MLSAGPEEANPPWIGCGVIVAVAMPPAARYCLDGLATCRLLMPAWQRYSNCGIGTGAFSGMVGSGFPGQCGLLLPDKNFAAADAASLRGTGQLESCSCPRTLRFQAPAALGACARCRCTFG